LLSGSGSKQKKNQRKGAITVAPARGQGAGSKTDFVLLLGERGGNGALASLKKRDSALKKRKTEDS